jgi:hypothetical protein
MVEKSPGQEFREKFDISEEVVYGPVGMSPEVFQTGVKFDQGKPRMELLPPELMVEVAKVLTFGAEKYEARNWEKGMDWGRIYGSLQRHLNAWASGEDTDPETGLSHLAHAGCNIAFLLAYTQRGVGDDSRYKTTTGS